MEFLNFNEDIVVEILCRLPKKSLIRFKCVCKQWHSLISNRNHNFPKTTHPDLVFQTFSLFTECVRRPSPLNFHRVDCSESTRVAVSDIEDWNCNLISFCNGFLLLQNRKVRIEDDFVVCHPASKRLWFLSPRKIQGRFIHVSLLSDGHHFKLSRFSIPCGRHGSIPALVPNVIDVFSSHGEEWRRETWCSLPNENLGKVGSMPWFVKELRRALVLVLSPSPSLTWKMETWDFGKAFLHSGAVYLMSFNYLYFCQLEDGDFKCILLPTFTYEQCNRNYEQECLWESEGCVNYCKVSSNRIRIWTLHKVELDGGGSEYSFQWKVKHEGVLLVPPTTTIADPTSFEPFAFNDDFEIVYFNSSKSRVFSYNLRTKETREACKSPFQDSVHLALQTAFPFFNDAPFDVSSITAWDKKVCNPRFGTISSQRENVEELGDKREN